MLHPTAKVPKQMNRKCPPSNFSRLHGLHLPWALKLPTSKIFNAVWPAISATAGLIVIYWTNLSVVTDRSVKSTSLLCYFCCPLYLLHLIIMIVIIIIIWPADFMLAGAKK